MLITLPLWLKKEYNEYSLLSTLFVFFVRKKNNNRDEQVIPVAFIQTLIAWNARL
jgi:hypothetical protein